MAWRMTAAALVVIAAGSSAWAETPLNRDYFIGYWGIGGANECASRDTMSFYASGAWAVTNGGENPVEAIGLWELKGKGVTVTFSDLRDTANVNTLDAGISDVTPNSFTMVAEPLQGGQAPLHRCG